MKAGWPAATARRIGLRGEVDFTTTRVGMTLHVPCARGHKHDVMVEPGSHPDQVAKKMLAKGWTFGRHLLCPEHGRKEKIKQAKPTEIAVARMTNMTPEERSRAAKEMVAAREAKKKEESNMATMATAVATKSEPSEAARKAKRLVYQALEDYYDDVKRTYRPGRSDSTIAKELGVSVEVVRAIREESFGPISCPPELTDLLAEALTIRADFAEYAKVADERFAIVNRKIADLCRHNGWPAPL